MLVHVFFLLNCKYHKNEQKILQEDLCSETIKAKKLKQDGTKANITKQRSLSQPHLHEAFERLTLSPS